MDSGLTDYRAALEALFARTGSTSKFGLERTFAFLQILGDPHHRIRTFHVAGTNGKGSVVATLYALLRSKGLHVGRYMSPHLIDFSERIVVDEQPVAEPYVLDFLERWQRPGEDLGATFFEITTAMALKYFADREVDVAVIETGLGGRLDATNVITPLVSGITSISIDHREYLGDSEQMIASEKAGIFKPGIPAVLGPVSRDARDAIHETASRAGVPSVIDAASVFRLGDITVSKDGTSFSVDNGAERERMTTGLVGTAQAGNTAVALTMLRAAGSNWEVPLAEARPILPELRLPGRFQQIGSYILDVAHNPDGIRALVETVNAVHPSAPLVAVVGVLRDKDWRQMLVTLAGVVDGMILVSAPGAPPDRAWDPREALAFIRARGVAAEVDDDFERAISRSAARGGTTLVTGSFHTVGDALRVLGQKAV